jgi:hypothetical protein
VLREILDEGFSVHFENNDLLQEIFAIELDKELQKQTLSALEKVPSPIFFFLTNMPFFLFCFPDQTKLLHNRDCSSLPHRLSPKHAPWPRPKPETSEKSP